MLAMTGIEGLDDVLGGGLARNHLYLVEGDPGAGKTTLALQFLLEGKRRGERVLYITLSESAKELEESATSHGWALDGISIFELKAAQQTALGGDVSVFHPGELELGEAMRTLLDEVKRVDPQRVVFDSLSEIRLLAQEPLRYRRQILALKQHFADKDCTVLMLDDRTAQADDRQVMSIAHGGLALDRRTPDYGVDRRRIHVTKMRGRRFRGGYHDFIIATGGLRVFPRLVAAEHRDAISLERVTSGNDDFDSLVGGGLTRGTSTLIAGPPGSGKSSLAMTFAATAAKRGEKSATFMFDESLSAYMTRGRSLNLGIDEHVKSGLVALNQVDPAELSAGELIDRVRRSVQDGARLVVIDSLNGYINSMPDEPSLIIQLHELLMFLSQKGIVSLLVAAQHGFVGSNMSTPIDVSYLTDTVVLMRYFESRGEVRSALSIVKQRTGKHEKTIRELTFTSRGITVGAPLSQFHGVLTGVPRFLGPDRDLVGQGDDAD